MTVLLNPDGAPARPSQDVATPLLSAADRFYIPALDGVRFLAFFLVFLHHLPPGDVFKEWSPRLAAVMLRLSLFGWSGVDLFLTLSGFLIAFLLLREIDATNTVSVRRFYARRMLRIWPLYYLMLVIGFFVVPICFRQASGPAYVTMLSQHLFPFATLFANFSNATLIGSLNATSPASDSLGLLWTVALEEQFYLIFPLVLLAAGRTMRLGTVLPYALGVIAFSACTRLYILANGIPYPMVWMNTLAHLDPLVLGIVGAVIWRRHHHRLVRLRLYGADALLAVGMLWVVMSYPQIGTSMHTCWQILAVSVGALLLIGAALRCRPLGQVFGCRPLAWLGRISYGLYVYQIVARQLYQYAFAPYLPIGLLHGPVRWTAEFLLVLGVTVVLAAVSYYGFERRFLRLKERFAITPSRPA